MFIAARRGYRDKHPITEHAGRRFEIDGRRGKKWCSAGRKWVYIFNRRKGKRLIPDEFIWINFALS